jgi:poly(A) polymerase
VLAARYNFTIAPASLPGLDGVYDLPVDYERKLLVDVLTGRYAWRGFELLMETGFVDRYWPELAPMNSTNHSKEFHPEGNVWSHSLETLKYRKTRDPLLSVALLLHDSGKPYAGRTKDRAFSDHAGIGARLARDFLDRLEFSREFRDSVAWLVEQHMLPGVLHTLPVHRTRMAMRNTLFPVLLELFRCDLSSTFEGPEGYYRACNTYRRFLKNDENPFRSADGKKLVQLYVE